MEPLLGDPRVHGTKRCIVDDGSTYLAAFHSLSDAAILVDSEHRVVDLNRAAARLVDEEDLVGGVHDEEAADLAALVRDEEVIGRRLHHVLPWLADALAASSLPGDVEAEAMVDGEWHCFEVSCSPLRDSQQQLRGTLLALRDVTERVEAVAALQVSEDRHRSSFESNLAVLLLLEPDTGRIVDANPAACAYYGLRRDELLAVRIHQICAPTEGCDPAAVDRGDLVHQRHRLAGGEIRDVELYTGPFSSLGRRLLYTIVHDVTERKRAEAGLEEANRRLTEANVRLEELSRTDPLTGVANRRSFLEALDREWRRAAREQASIALLMVDIDHFKAYNDHYGHLEGDACLQRVAAALRSALRRPADLLARYGGEEFVALLPSTDGSGAISVASSMRDRLAREAIPHAGSAAADLVTVSIGLTAIVPDPGSQARILVAAADDALYQAKRAGRDRWSQR